MATLHFDVDTAPMARTMDSVNGHVNGVTVAVTAMEGAVIAAELQSSRTICENVDNGFYVLVKSQISQKAVAAYSEMNSKLGILAQLLKALDSIKNQMQADYNMICRRYHKLFQSLNNSLETRVRELDRPAMKMAEIKNHLVLERLRNDSSTLFSAAQETVSVGQLAIGGKIKRKTRDTMSTLYDSAVESRTYNEKLESILVKKTDDYAGRAPDVGGTAENYFFLPVVFSSSQSLLNPEESIENVYMAREDESPNPGQIAAEVKQNQEQFAWTGLNEKEKEFVKKEFILLCENDNSDERLNREILRLFDESSWEVPQNEL
jgi:hypothetical protein